MIRSSVEKGLLETMQPGHQFNLLEFGVRELAADGKYAEAITLAEQAALRAEADMGPFDPYTARALHTLAVLYEKQGRQQEAEALLKRVLAIFEASENEGLFLSGLNELASFYLVHGRPVDAEALYERMREIRQASFGTNYRRAVSR